MDQLSNYELLDLFTSYTTDGAGHFMNFLAVFSAYLVAGYLAGAKVSRTFIIALSTLYLVVTAMTALGSYTTISAALNIAAEIADRDLSNATSLVATARTMSGTAGTLTLILNPLIQIVACLVSIVFVLSYSAKAAQNHE